MQVKQVILGTASPFRIELFATLGLPFKAVASAVNEKEVHHNSAPEMAKMRANFKAHGCKQVDEVSLIVTADQVLEFAGQAFGKVNDAQTAKERLKQFAGKQHALHSAYSLHSYDPESDALVHLNSRVVTVTMSMRALHDDEIAAYVATGEWQGCAGCYRFEAAGVQLFDKVEGTSAAIVGLPMLELAEDLRALGLNPLRKPSGPWVLV